MRSERKNPFFLVYSNTRHTMKSDGVATSNTQSSVFIQPGLHSDWSLV